MSKNGIKSSQIPELVNAINKEIGLDAPEITKDNFNVMSELMSQPANANAFWSKLTNKVYETIVKFKVWNNPLSVFKEGSVPYGEIIENISMNEAPVKDYATDNDTQFSVVKADVKVEYFTKTESKFTCVTMNRAQLKEAFQSPSALAKAINENINTLVSGQYIHEYNTLKGVLTDAVEDGNIKKTALTGLPATQSDADAIVEVLRNYYLKFQFPSTAYNCYTGAEGETAYKTWTLPDDIYIIISADLNSKLDVYALSKAFNIAYDNLIGHIIVLDDIGSFTSGSATRVVDAVMIDRAFIQWRSYEQTSSESFDARYLNYKFYNHFWNGFDVSKLANGMAFYHDVTA